jgi:hypothetical protein
LLTTLLKPSKHEKLISCFFAATISVAQNGTEPILLTDMLKITVSNVTLSPDAKIAALRSHP